MDKPEMSEMEAENKRLREENEKLRLREEYRNSLPFKERMYDKVPLSLKTMDIIIGCLLVLLVVTLIMGIAAK